jgi:hypothetical protein
MYKHALILLSDESDGQFLLQSVAQNFHEQGTAITLGHLTSITVNSILPPIL